MELMEIQEEKNERVWAYISISFASEMVHLRRSFSA
jgi:hypothetical protein